MGLIPYPFSIDWFSYTHIAKLQTKLKREKKRRIQCECLTRKHRSFPFVLNLVFIPRNTHGFRNPKRAIKSCVWGKKALCFHSFQYKHVKLHEKAPHSMFIETGCKAAKLQPVFATNKRKTHNSTHSVWDADVHIAALLNVIYLLCALSRVSKKSFAFCLRVFIFLAITKRVGSRKMCTRT